MPEGALGTRRVEIVDVRGKAAMTRFIRLPARLHRDDPMWVQPLEMERRLALSPDSNPYFQHSEVRFWIARCEGRDAGRISAQLDRLAPPSTAGPVGHFGLLAAENDPALVRALLRAAESWLRARGAAEIVGPFSLSINEEAGLLVEGFQRPPMLMMGHDRPWLGPLVEQAGYAGAKDLYAYSCDSAAPLPRGAAAMAARALPPQIRIRPLDKRRYRHEIAAATRIFNDAWADNWGFVPLTEAEMAHMAAQMKPLVDERLVWIAEVAGEPVGFIVCLPNLNEAIAGLGGRLLPAGWLKLLWRLKVRGLATARIPLMGIRRDHARTLLGSLIAVHLIAAVRREAGRLGYRRIELSWVLDDNQAVRRVAEAFAGAPDKVYRLYRKRL